MIFVAPPDREARLESRTPASDLHVAWRRRQNAGGMEGVLARLQASLDRVEARQGTALNIARRELRFARPPHAQRHWPISVSNWRKAAAPAPAATGGPFVPFKPKADGGPFERQLYRIALARTSARPAHARHGDGAGAQTGARRDRYDLGFRHAHRPVHARVPPCIPAWTSAASRAIPIRATASGTVTHAGWNGGYGKMVEIDHGNGLSTRYATFVGDRGRGRPERAHRANRRPARLDRPLDGPHLHYETRVEGEAVDPQKFLRAGIRLGEKL